MRESWTDERLDGFAIRVDERFDSVDRRFDQVDEKFAQVGGRFDRVENRLTQVEASITRLDVTVERLDASIGHLNKDFRELRVEIATHVHRIETRFDSVQRTMIITFAGLAASVIAALITTAH